MYPLNYGIVNYLRCFFLIHYIIILTLNFTLIMNHYISTHNNHQLSMKTDESMNSCFSALLAITELDIFAPRRSRHSGHATCCSAKWRLWSRRKPISRFFVGYLGSQWGEISTWSHHVWSFWCLFNKEHVEIWKEMGPKTKGFWGLAAS